MKVSLRRVAVLAAVLAAGPSCVRTVSPPGGPQAAADLDVETWVHNTLSGMTLEERVGQLLMAELRGGFANVRASELREARRLITEQHVGGFLVGAGAPLETAQKLNELQSLARLPLLVAADLEAGAGMGLVGADGASGGTVFPYNMGLAASGDELLAELAGRITAVEARAVGIHWLLAPVVDVNTTSDNPIINVRSYASDPATVARFAAAFIRGAASRGVLTTAKHFPGHGHTRVDSRVGTPVINVDTVQLGERELPPFRAAIAAGVSSVMLGHVAVPTLTRGYVVPASIAPEIGTDLLRGRLGFGGLIITDAMNVAALRETLAYSPGELAVRAVEAGADVVLAPPDPALAHRALVQAVRSGRLPYMRVDSSVARVLRAKARLGLHERRLVSLDSAAHAVGAPEHGIVAENMAARVLTLVRDSAGVLPLDPRRIRNVAIVAFTVPDDVHAGSTLHDEMTRIYGRGVTFIRVDERMGEAVHDSAAAQAARADATVLATFLMPVPGQGHIGMPTAARKLAVRLQSASARLAVVAFGDPYASSALPGASTYLLAWQPRAGVSGRAVARALAGHASIPGRLPIQLPRSTSVDVPVPPARYGLQFARPEDVGMDPVALARVDSIIRSGITSGASPGVAVAIGRHGRLVRLAAYGELDRRRGYGMVTDSSIYDMASVTKVVATTTALMMLVDEGLIGVDDPVRTHLPDWRGTAAKERVTIRNLLVHNSGLPAYAPLWRELNGRSEYRRRLTAMPLVYEPGSRTLYSDFGVILLGMIVEEVSGQTLDALMRERLFAPLEMRDTGFNPLRWPYGPMDLGSDDHAPRAAPDPLITRIAPTENDEVVRKRHIHGEVHDENAFALGGVAGHAGLFSSARDMAIFAQLMLNRGFYGGRRFIDPATVDLFTGRQDPSSSRALGWDTPEGASSAGSYFTASSYGHTGFTGPSIWIDPERDVFVVLLMNRVNPTRDNQRHVGLRRDVADAVQLAITDMPVYPRPSPPPGPPVSPTALPFLRSPAPPVPPPHW